MGDGAVATKAADDPQRKRRLRKVRQYALAYFRQRIAPWRWTEDEAKQDALRRGDASRDRRSKVVYLTVPADILERWVWVEAEDEHDDNVIQFPGRSHLRLVK